MAPSSSFSASGSPIPDLSSAAIRQINFFVQMSILLATFYQVQKTGGRQSTNWVVWTATIWSLFFGVLSFSKQGMLTGPITWFGAAIAAGHNFTRRQIVGAVLAALFFQIYLVPVAQIGRVFRVEQPTISSDLKLAYTYLTSLNATRQSFLLDEKNASEDFGTIPHLYDQRQGFADRLNMLSFDDALVDYTDHGDYEGSAAHSPRLFSTSFPTSSGKTNPSITPATSTPTKSA